MLRKLAGGWALCARVEGRDVAVGSEGGRELEGKVEFIGRRGAAENGGRWGFEVEMESVDWVLAVAERGG